MNEQRVGDRFYQTITSLSSQCSQAFTEASQVNVPDDYANVSAVVVCGMGGSALGPEILKDDLAEGAKIPFLVNRDYDLPYVVNEDDLVVLSSYSGNTEEVLTCGQEALERKAKLLAITTGGKLAQMAQKEGFPLYLIDPKHNPSGQPRLGLGYSEMGLIGLLSRIGIIHYSKEQMAEMAKWLDGRVEELRSEAELVSKRLVGKIPILIGAGHLRGAVHAISNCLNENSKNFSAYFYLPELNHHLLEGLSFPKNAPENVVLVLAESELYLSPNQRRVKLTREIFEQQNYSTITFCPQAEQKLTQAMETVLFGWWLACFLAKLNGVADPLAVPQVEGFKKRLNG